MTKKRRRRNIETVVLAEIENQMSLSPPPSAAAIRRSLISKFTEALAPSLRTLQDIVREMTPPPDESGRWALPSAEPEDVALVMPVVSAVAEATRGQLQEITRAEAACVAQVRRAAPELPLLVTYQTARLYVARAARKETTTDLDLFLSAAPWRDEERAQRYYAAVYEGWMPPPPTFLDATVSRDFNIPARVIASALYRPSKEPEQPPPVDHGRSPRQLQESFKRTKSAPTAGAKAPKAKPQTAKRRVKK